MAKKSIVEEALLEAKQLEEALKKNSKEILAATMKQDIDEMVKASLFEGDEMATEVEEELETESQMEGSEEESSTMVTDEDELISEEEESDDETTEDSEIELSGDDEESGEESLDFDMTSDEESGDDEESMEMDFTEEPETTDSEVIDMTDASHDELISVFKKMSDDDEIEVVKVGNNVNLKDKSTGAEYMIKMDESMSYDDEDETMSYDDEDETMSYDEMMNFDEMMHGDEDEGMDMKKMFSITSKDETGCDECGWQESDDQEPIYEITFDDSDDDDEDDDFDFDFEEISKIKKMPKDVGSDYSDDEETEDVEDLEDFEDSEELEDEDESWGPSDEGTRRTLHDRRAKQIHPQNYPMNESIKSEYKKVIREYEELKDKYSQTKDALKVFRDKLGEIALFNSNLTHAVKLFMEHATTKQEKTDIMKRFDDEAITLKESKRLYKTLTNELKDRKPISEKVEKKINESLTKSTSDTLIESKVYVDPQISKIHSLIDRLENR